MRDLIADHANHLDLLAGGVSTTVTEILNRHLAAISAARDAEYSAIEVARTEMAEALQGMATECAATIETYRAEAEAAIEAARAGLAAKTAEFLGDVAPKLPEVNLPFPFGLIVPVVGASLARGSTVLRAEADYIVNEAGEVLKSRPNSAPPPIMLRLSDIESIIAARGYDASNSRDAMRAVILAYAEKLSERRQSNLAGEALTRTAEVVADKAWLDIDLSPMRGDSYVAGEPSEGMSALPARLGAELATQRPTVDDINAALAAE